MKNLFPYLLFIVSLFGVLSRCSSHPFRTEKSESSTIVNNFLPTDTLTPLQYAVLRLKETEPPYSGKWLNHKEKGTYTCAGCGMPLFADSMKFDSHCGWPSFDRELGTANIRKEEDRSHGMVRTEILCRNCGGHLGHLFDDGPTATGLRYCVNSAALNFTSASPIAEKSDTITLGGGCFWCIEAVFEELKGVKQVESGYSGGRRPDPTYEEVSEGGTGYVEVVQVIFDPVVISYEDILKVFFTVHDPTTPNRQGADVGEQYRSVIFYHTPRQRDVALDLIAALNRKQVYEAPVVTGVEAFRSFYRAEAGHQNYYSLNINKPYCRMVIRPKLEKLERVFSDKLRTSKP